MTSVNNLCNLRHLRINPDHIERFNARNVCSPLLQPTPIPLITTERLAEVRQFFVLLGIEKVQIVPGITGSNPFDLYYMPYTHSLAAAVGWAIAATLLARRLGKWGADTRAAWLFGLAVFSHWVLDLIVHRPDLPIYDNTAKVGFGLWNLPVVAFALELAVLFGGMWLYFRGNTVRRLGFIVFGLVMAAIQAYVFFGPPPVSDRAFAWTALVFYAVFAAVAAWLERGHSPRPVAVQLARARSEHHRQHGWSGWLRGRATFRAYA